jgi:2-octaprenyl-6-methoxyphenol hydroxylase
MIASFLSELQSVFGYRLGTLKQVGARHLYPLSLVEAEEQVRRIWRSSATPRTACTRLPVRVSTCRCAMPRRWPMRLLASDKPLGDFGTLQAYRERQRLDQNLTVGFSDQVTRLFGSTQPLVSLGRNLRFARS